MVTKEEAQSTINDMAELTHHFAANSKTCMGALQDIEALFELYEKHIPNQMNEEFTRILYKVKKDVTLRQIETQLKVSAD